MTDNKKSNDTNKENDKKYVIVDCISTFHMRYVVELNKDDPDEWALDDVTMEDTVEFSQKHIGENIISHRSTNDKDEILKLAREDNSYLSGWSDEQIMDKLISKQYKP